MFAEVQKFPMSCANLKQLCQIFQIVFSESAELVHIVQLVFSKKCIRAVKQFYVPSLWSVSVPCCNADSASYCVPGYLKVLCLARCSGGASVPACCVCFPTVVIASFDGRLTFCCEAQIVTLILRMS
ncbi:hypothetical protein BaRGS_00005412 [Batillaria attramentaria]|uniref:Uncharacterized protein n=1 Tax=Batillaria attramentaria TaxID=370345 RepID=A0ABD0LWK5_9CAEN